MKYYFIVLLFLYCSNYNDPSSLILSIMQLQPITLIKTVNQGINWKFILSEMLQDSIFLNEIPPDSVLLVNMIKDNTNGIVQPVKITNILIDLVLNSNNTYNVVSINKLYDAYRSLEISSEEILDSYAFSIEIALYLKADYIIYSIIYGDLDTISIELQLISTKTREIIHVINRSIDQQDFIYN